MRKALLILIALAGLGFGNEIGSGTGSSYPYTLDRDTAPETADNFAREDVPNDIASAVIKVEVTLGSAPAGSYSDVATRLNALSLSTGAFVIVDEPVRLSTGIIALNLRVSTETITRDMRASSQTLTTNLRVSTETLTANLSITTGTLASNHIASMTIVDAYMFANNISTGVLQSDIDTLKNSPKKFYFTLNDDIDSAPQYYMTRSTIPSTTRTLTRTLSEATPTTEITISTWVVNYGAITEIKAGRVNCEYYASMSAGTANIIFVVYDGTGTAMIPENIISSTVPQGITTTLEERIAYFTLFVNYTLKSKYGSVAMIAYENNTPDRILTLNCGGSYDGHIDFPANSLEVSVSKIIAGQDITISPNSGIADVTVNLSTSALTRTSSTTFNAGIQGTSMVLTNGATFYGKLNTRYITSGDAGVAGDVFTHFVSSDSWGKASGGGSAPAGASGSTTYYMTLGGYMQDIYASATIPYDTRVMPDSVTITGIMAYAPYSALITTDWELKASTGSSSAPTWATSIGTISLSSATTTGWKTLTYDINDSATFIGAFVNWCPTSGTIPVGAGVIVRYWRKQ